MKQVGAKAELEPQSGRESLLLPDPGEAVLLANPGIDPPLTHDASVGAVESHVGPVRAHSHTERRAPIRPEDPAGQGVRSVRPGDPPIVRLVDPVALQRFLEEEGEVGRSAPGAEERHDRLGLLR